MLSMTGRPGYRTTEMIGGSSASYLARTPGVPLFCTLFKRGVETEGLLDYLWRAGIISIVRWNLHTRSYSESISSMPSQIVPKNFHGGATGCGWNGGGGGGEIQESRGPLGPKSPKSLQKVFPGLPGRSV